MLRLSLFLLLLTLGCATAPTEPVARCGPVTEAPLVDTAGTQVSTVYVQWCWDWGTMSFLQKEIPFMSTEPERRQELLTLTALYASQVIMVIPRVPEEAGDSYDRMVMARNRARNVIDASLWAAQETIRLLNAHLADEPEAEVPTVPTQVDGLPVVALRFGPQLVDDLRMDAALLHKAASPLRGSLAGRNYHDIATNIEKAAELLGQLLAQGKKGA